MFKRHQTAKILRSFLCARPEQLDPRTAFARIVDFYENERAHGAQPIEHDGDMLLFQFGTFDWGRGPFFELDLTRQVIYGDYAEDEGEMWQLHLTYRYAPDAELSALGTSDRWFSSPSCAGDARAHIDASTAVESCLRRTAVEVELHWGRV